MKNKRNKIKLLIDTNQANIDPQCLQEIIDLIFIDPTQAEIEEILDDYDVIFKS
ncbi:hypothetical protein SH1V18_33850 [Vallitalea longa]|uniref:Uncharacterized protein n=1 Tax=Vallitalea longa TaxID=2936439 RepID=A0A9W5YE80_9FIRM|nr:hypothetical protein [Vallitalea longa]GKX30905.1 hypothetical protein SH1V18_33850 [Vallitalea longa]